jgi:NADPH-dependent F420 reductase
VAILGGTGAEGSGLALRWAQAGIPIAIGSRERARAEATAARIRQQLGASADVTGYTNPEAASRSNLVVLTVPFAAQLPTLASVRDSLRPGTILVDVTVPLATAVGGRPTQVLRPWAGSAAEQAAAAVPEGVVVVSAFHHLSAEVLADRSRRVECDVLVCGNDRAAKQCVRALVQAIEGAGFVDAGPLANARIVEAVAALLIGINVRYKTHSAGIRITGIP